MSGFRDWLMKQNVLALALAFVVGSALAAVVSSLVADVIMPPVGLLLGGVSFTDLYTNLGGKVYPSLAAAREAGAPVIAWGQFINTVITFVIVAFVVYLLARALVKEGRTCPFCGEAIGAAAKRCPHCTSELATA